MEHLFVIILYLHFFRFGIYLLFAGLSYNLYDDSNSDYNIKSHELYQYFVYY